ncbi:Acetate transporter GPR1/FUN34/SatP family [Trypanosoma melophagium]|uniref:Acetate transporter GPR1/FUN34/SatP family n=1 Tax=Trypanosoma melophagium TaxID=715481 RepID=UPI00351A7C9F|nr:Acetate transporter GPR1/FUN34/SatP family [Trypanosoma melophagium]
MFQNTHNEPHGDNVKILLPDVKSSEQSESGKLTGALTSGNADKTAMLQEVLRALLEDNEVVIAKKKPAPVNVGPLGLVSFSMTTVLLNLHNVGLYELNSVVPAVGLTLGGFLQMLVGLLDYFQGNTFGCLAFMAYGAFWLSLVAVWLLPQGDDHPHVSIPTQTFLGFYLLLWGLFTCCLGVITFFKLNRMMQLVFSTLAILYFLLAAGNFTKNSTILKVAGWEGIFCALGALYIAFSEILEDNLGYPVLPLFHVKRN